MLRLLLLSGLLCVFAAEITVATETKNMREHYAKIKLSGGVVKDINEVKPACKTMEDYVEFMSFVLYGEGSLPEKSRCWELKAGTKVKLVTWYSAVHSNCNKTKQICRFEKDTLLQPILSALYLDEPFYSSLHVIEAR